MKAIIVQKGVHTSEGVNKGKHWLLISAEVDGFEASGFVRTKVERKEKVGEEITLPATIASAIQWRA